MYVHGELNDKFQGDIILTKEQEEQLFGMKRTGLVNDNYRWPNNTVVYEISSAFEQNRVESIELGLRRIEEVTCIRFVKRTDEVNYVFVTANNAGCSSNVGFLNNGMQRLNLEPGDFCFRIGTIIHEFLHTLGFYHMHSATERDDYVTIMWENIQPGTESNFNTYGADRITNFGVEYDILSVMHYNAYSATRNGFATIVPHDISLIDEMGQRTGLSPKDIARINRMYNCDVV
ncbi:hypothetical protein HA402_007066 [Bradysia odoriphaga]|nr:hypothetical protein HA402_007066 [Bradysia odoriphaga]